MILEQPKVMVCNNFNFKESNKLEEIKKSFVMSLYEDGNYHMIPVNDIKTNKYTGEAILLEFVDNMERKKSILVTPWQGFMYKRTDRDNPSRYRLDYIKASNISKSHPVLDTNGMVNCLVEKTNMLVEDVEGFIIEVKYNNNFAANNMILKSYN